MVRAVLGHVGEVVGYRLKASMLAALGDVAKLPLVNTIRIHLLVVQADRADELVRREATPPLFPQPLIGCEVAVLREPAGGRARVNGYAETPVNVAGCLLNGIPAVEMAEGFEGYL